MTYSVPVFGTERNIPTVPAGTERNLIPWVELENYLSAARISGKFNSTRMVGWGWVGRLSFIWKFLQII